MTARYRLGFRPDIEGLRAVAVLAVLAFHAGVPGLAGGFIGVDVFFVVSGFLITGLLLRDISASGSFSLPEFYARRARRILPAAGLVLLATAAGAWLLLPPLRGTDVAGDVVAAALSIANWRFAAGQTDYLAAERDPSPLLHYWSLAVEEQFYLLWAPLLLVLALAARRLRRDPVPAVTAAVVVLTGGSLALSLWWTEISEPLAYLASPSRAWQFGAGALAAVLLPYGQRPRSASSAVLGLAGAVAVLWPVLVYDAATPYPGTAALVPTLGAVAVIAFRSPFSALLSLAPVRAVGRLSFSWYLWHWPVLVLTEAAAGPQPWSVKLALVLGSAIPAGLTMKLVENPLRTSRVVAALPRRGLALGTSAVVVPVAAALLLNGGAVHGATVTPRVTVAETPPGGALQPPPAQARVDYPASAGCEIGLTAVTSPPCLFGNTASKNRVVLIGDSHAGQWFAAAERIALRRGWALEVLVKPGCPLPRLTVVDPRLDREYRECDAWREYALDRLDASSPPRLVLLASLNAYTRDRAVLTRAWDTTLARLERLGASLVYLRDTPLPGTDVPACLSGSPVPECAFPRAAGLRPDPLAEQVAAGERPGMRVLDMSPLLCPGTGRTCPAALDGIVLYRDDSHITDTLARRLAPRIERDLEDLDVIPTVL
ncbi:acyltransferase [Planomonospora sp. ID67723]|uniref:acyltransferase family protein n=1 Tax=Planomonospora sp. ID67723 TaxID=2738134 RepID=UPI0018C41949|nr:acyltransferase family protein [Planomonospora sp. ID67723]MBG0826629.1 acyltransferase [Planomonospora sp. ID67723]